MQGGFHGFFDPSFYRRRHALGSAGSLEHFIDEGDRAGFDPSPYFSTRFYKEYYPDWQESGARVAVEDLLLRLEAGETRQPHPLIDPAFYRGSYPDLASVGPEIVLHFLRCGDAERRRPSAAFDADFYARCYLPLAATHPFRHFVTEGEASGFLPSPISRDAAASGAAMARALRGAVRPMIFCAHDAQAAGVPILTLDLAEAAARRGWQPFFLLQRAGPLLHRYQALGPTNILAEGWDAAGLIAAIPDDVPAIVNTSEAADLATLLAGGGRPCLLLIHEMADHIHERALLPALHAARVAGAELVASVPPMAAALRDEFGPLATIRPGIKRQPASLDAFRRIRRRMAGHTAVFLGAGHGCRRKGFDLFLDAARRISARLPDAGFVWLGALDDWASRLAEAALADGLALTLPGFVTDAAAWYRAADVYLLTSRQDPGPTTAFHAALTGTPFVAYAADIGLVGQAEGVGDFLAPGDEAGLVEAALAAAQRGQADRRALRRLVAREGAFDTYFEALLARLNAHPKGGGA